MPVGQTNTWEELMNDATKQSKTGATPENDQASDARSDKTGDPAGAFKKVVDGKEPSNLDSSKQKNELGSGAGYQGATKPLNVYRAENAMPAEREAGEDSGSSDKTQLGPLPFRPTVSKAIITNLPRVAGDNESTQYFQIPGSAYPSLREGSSVSEERTPARDSARQAIGFTQLLRSVSSREKVDIPKLSAVENSRKGNAENKEESIHSALYQALKATKERPGSPSPSFKERSRADDVLDQTAARNYTPLPRPSLHNSGGRLHALLPWLLVLDLAMTTLVFIGVVYILFRIWSIPVSDFLSSHSW
jgi:hypothetical protein